MKKMSLIETFKVPLILATLGTLVLGTLYSFVRINTMSGNIVHLSTCFLSTFFVSKILFLTMHTRTRSSDFCISLILTTVVYGMISFSQFLKNYLISGRVEVGQFTVVFFWAIVVTSWWLIPILFGIIRLLRKLKFKF